MTSDPAAPAQQPARQPRVRGNDWPALSPGPVGDRRPTRSVTIVVPAHQASATLPYTLASLAAQTYPEDLLEVLVVDDGSEPPVTLPALCPPHTRVLSTSASWGPAEARHVGALEAAGEVLHWLDADMLLERDELEAQMRWHHLVDYAVVLGTKTFVDVSEPLPDPEVVAQAIRDGRTAELLEGRWTARHEWVEEHIERTHGLTGNPTSSYLVHVGATASVRRDLYLDTGGMDRELRTSEDIELGYRLAQQGAVFVPDADARSWHLGRSMLMARQEAVNRYNRPFVTDRVPDLRHWRTRGRSYTVPWVEVVLEAADHTYEEVRHSVEGVLTGSLADVGVVVLGPWSRLADDRRSLLDDPDRDLRMVRAGLLGDPRVRFADEVPPTAFPATFRLRLPAGWSPGPDTVRKLAREMTRKDRGLVSLLLPDGRVARLERTSAFTRAARIAGATSAGTGVADLDDLDDLVDQVSTTWWYDAVEEGFTHVSDADRPPGQASAQAAARPGGASRRRPAGAARQESLAAPPSETSAPAAGPSEEPARPAVRDRLGRALRRRAPRR